MLHFLLYSSICMLRYAIHPMGMTLSVQMDKLMLYQSIMCLSLLLIWSVNITSWCDYRKKAARR